jgi:hypothetical protein
MAIKILNTESMSRAAETGTGDTGWQSLYNLGGAAALVMAALIPIAAIPFILTPIPETVSGWFALMQNHPALGLAMLDVPNLIVNVIGALLYLALFAALRQIHPSYTAVALTLGLMAATLYITANPAFGMFSLSLQYQTATTEAQRAILLAAGQTLLTLYQSSTAFNISYAMGAAATLIMSIVMLNSGIFSKRTATAGILASLITLGLFVPKIGLYISIFSLIPYAIWLILVARRFFLLGRFNREEN